MGSPASSDSFLPWLTLVSIIWLQSISATNSDFSEYSSNLKARLAITQVQLNYLAVASDSGKLFGWCSGLAAKHLPLPYILLIGSAIGVVGYGIPFLFLTNIIPSLTYWQAVLLSMLAGNSICWINTACYVAAMRKFPSDSATVVGLSTSYSALSAKIYIAVSQVISSSNHSIYLLLNTFTPLAVSLLTAPLLFEGRYIGYTWLFSRAGFFTMFTIAAATGVYSVVVTVVPFLKSLRVAKVILLMMVAGIPIGWLWERWCKKAEEVEMEVEEVVVVERGREYGVRELMGSVDFWLYFLVYLCGGTLGLVYMNNLGQISQSRGVADSVLLSITSSFGFFGKLASAPLSALTRSKYTLSRPALMSVLMAPMTASFFLLLDPTTIVLFISTAIIGLCSGAMTSIAVSMTTELFGTKHFSVNHNILIANIPIGSFLFGYIAGHVYDKEGNAEHDVNGSCFGVQCYQRTFILWGMICFVGTLLSVVLYFRTRRRVPKIASYPA